MPSCRNPESDRMVHNQEGRTAGMVMKTTAHRFDDCILYVLIFEKAAAIALGAVRGGSRCLSPTALFV